MFKLIGFIILFLCFVYILHCLLILIVRTPETAYVVEAALIIGIFFIFMGKLLDE